MRFVAPNVCGRDDCGHMHVDDWHLESRPMPAVRCFYCRDEDGLTFDPLHNRFMCRDRTVCEARNPGRFRR